MHILISIIGILITIFFVIGTHEAAHFLTARALGVKVLRFSIGFGKRLLHWHDKKGTEYVIALIPLGGYVKMLDENEGDVPPNERHLAYNCQPIYKKFLIVLAGPAMNIFCALILYWIIFMVGFNTIKPIIGEVKADSIAAESGLMPNSEITQIDQKDTATWTGILFRILVHAGNNDQLIITTKNLKTQQIQSHHLDLTHWQLGGLTPDPLSSLGIVPFEPKIPLIIQTIAKSSPAEHSPLRVGDKIIAINGKPIKSWTEIITTINKNPGDAMKFTIERNTTRHDFLIEVGEKTSLFGSKKGFLGIAPLFKWPPGLMHKVKYSPGGAFLRASQEIVDFTYFNFLIFGKMITGKISLQSLGGPITIFESAGDALHYGFIAFIGFLAFLSISIGVINLLPIPGLDGGHLLIQIIEVIIRKPVPERVLLLMYRLGFIFLIFILFQALMNDILRMYE